MTTNVTAAPPAKMQQAMQALSDSQCLEAALACAMCRERHGGWCIDEMWAASPAACPLVGLAPTMQADHRGPVEPVAE